LVYKDIYTITLVAKLFKVLMAIVIIFDLKIWQDNVINAFINSLIDKIVYIKYLNGFAIKNKYLLLFRVLYRL